MHQQFISADELLRRCLIYRINELWERGFVQKWKDERWFKIYQKKQNENQSFLIENLPNGFFEALTTDINLIIQQKLNFPKRELSQYTISSSSLKRFLGKNREQGGYSEKKKTGLAIYVGFRHNHFHIGSWDDFNWYYREYMRFWHIWELNKLSEQYCLVTEQEEFISFESERALPVISKVSVIMAQMINQALLDNRFAQSPDYSRSKKKYALITAIFVIATILGSIWLISFQQDANLPETNNKAIFKLVRYRKGENRASIQIAYDISQLKMKDVLIRASQGDIIPAFYNAVSLKDTVSFMLSKPGGEIELVAQGRVIKKIRIFQETSGWIGWAKDVQNNKSTYHKACELVKDGIISYPQELVPEHYKQYYFSYLKNSRYFGVEGNQATFEVRFRLVNKPMDATCNEVKFNIYGNDGMASTMFELKGCEYWMGMCVADSNMKSEASMVDLKNRKIANYDMLSAFTHDMNTYQQWNIFKIVIENQIATYYWNQKKIFEFPFKGNIGEIIGLEINGKGSWSIDWVKLSNNQGIPMYFENFNDCQKIEQTRRSKFVVN